MVNRSLCRHTYNIRYIIHTYYYISDNKHCRSINLAKIMSVSACRLPLTHQSPYPPRAGFTRRVANKSPAVPQRLNRIRFTKTPTSTPVPRFSRALKYLNHSHRIIRQADCNNYIETILTTRREDILLQALHI